MNDIRILVTGVGAFVAPSIIKNYTVIEERNIYVVGVDIKPIVSNKYIDKYYQYKKPTDKDYIEINENNYYMEEKEILFIINIDLKDLDISEFSINLNKLNVKGPYFYGPFINTEYCLHNIIIVNYFIVCYSLFRISSVINIVFSDRSILIN